MFLIQLLVCWPSWSLNNKNKPETVIELILSSCVKLYVIIIIIIIILFNLLTYYCCSLAISVSCLQFVCRLVLFALFYVSYLAACFALCVCYFLAKNQAKFSAI